MFMVPEVRKNLFSIGVCTEKGYGMGFIGPSLKIENNGQIVATGARQSNRIFRMSFRVPSPRNEANVSATDLKVWHERLEHINERSLCQ